jgi:hypothetical protein
VNRPCATLTPRMSKPRFHNKQALHHNEDNSYLTTRNSVAILLGDMLHGTSNGANTLVVYCKPNTGPLSATQPGASPVQRWVGVRDGPGCARAQLDI